MTISYEWKFEQFDVKPSQSGLSDVVSVIHWRLNAIDSDNIVATNYGTVVLDDPNPSEFIPFSEITKEMAIEWVSLVLDVDSIKNNLSEQIDRIKNPPVVPMTPPFGVAGVN